MMEKSLKKSKNATKKTTGKMLNAQKQSYVLNLSKRNITGNKTYGKKILEPLRAFKKARPSFETLGSIELELCPYILRAEN